MECASLTGKALHAENRERNRRLSRAHYRANKEHHKAKVKEWQDANRERYEAAKKRWKYETLNGYLSRKITGVRHGCKQRGRARRGIKCRIVPADLRDLLQRQGGRCALTGRELKINGGQGDLDGLSVDRIDPDGDYTPANIRLVTYQANQARMRGTDAELVGFCRDVLTYKEEQR